MKKETVAKVKAYTKWPQLNIEKEPVKANTKWPILKIKDIMARVKSNTWPMFKRKRSWAKLLKIKNIMSNRK